MRSAVVDAVVIGSGAGAGVAAGELRRRGMDVLVLEKGPEYSRAQYVHDEIAICRRDFFVPPPWRDPHVVVRDGAIERSTMGYTAVCVGGGTVHMAGYFYRMLPDDFRLRSRFGIGFDWPFPYGELEPY
jgi:choline dehydrogenase-like flavoprotein